MIKTNGSREPFDEDKLRSGILRAIEKRPVSVEDVEAALNRIKHQLRATGEREVASDLVGEAVMAQLQQLDEVDCEAPIARNLVLVKIQTLSTSWTGRRVNNRLAVLCD